MMWNILLGILTILGLAYAYVRKKYSYWTDRGIPGPKPEFPMGNFQGLAITRHPADITKVLYEEWKGKGSFVGMFLFTSPTVLVLDPDLVKNMLVRDFDHFRNRGFYYNRQGDPLSAHLFAIDGKSWKDMRTKLTPTFTSGKMKMMYHIILKTANRMVDHLMPIASQGGIVDIKDIVARYTTDVIITCALGIECNSIKEPECDFRVKGRAVFDPKPIQQYRLFFGNVFPWMARKLGVRAIEKHISDFFLSAVNATIKYRKTNNVEQKDFMQLLLEIQKKHENSPQKFSDLDIAAQSFVFFIAGFETSGTTTTFGLYELAKNPEIQERLRREINDVLEKHNNELTYEAIHAMTYLDQVVDETLRKYPAVDNLLRKTVKDYLVPGTKHVIEKGTQIFIPVYGLHRDPDLYPDPDIFDPERFTEENKAKRHPFSYLPFGGGPRNCIGLRFGKMQVRLGLISFIRNFQVLPSADTPEKITFSITELVIASEKPIKLHLKPLHM